MAEICKIEHAVGETRAAIVKNGKPVEYHLRRWSLRDLARAGDVYAGRVAEIDKQLMMAFIDLGAGPHGVLRFSMSPNAPRLVQGDMISVKILRESEPGKGPLLYYIGKSEATKPAAETRYNLEQMLAHKYSGLRFVSEPVDGVEWAAESEIKLPSGGYIYIEHTRAVTAIDIDTAGGQKLKVSLEAAKEIARQLRLRGIGGLVLIDFPNFRKKKERADVWQTLSDHFKNDPGSVKLAPMSRFDTVELTRARTGPTIAQIILGPTGQHSAETTALMGLRRLEKEARIDGGAKLTLQVPQPAHDWLAADTIGWAKAMRARIGARFEIKAGDKMDVFK